MPDSDWSDNDNHQNTKTKSNKKRRRSYSIERDSGGKKKNSKQKKLSGKEYEKEIDTAKKKSRKYDENSGDDPQDGKVNKSRDKHKVHLDSENEHTEKKRVKKDNKTRHPNRDYRNDDELKREKYNTSSKEDFRRSEKKEKMKRHSSRKNKHESDDENDKYKKYDLDAKSSKEDYKENSESMRTSHGEKRYKNKYEDDFDRHEDNSNREDSDRHGSGSDKPFRYWSFSRGPVRKNSDSYWNKYSDRLKETNEDLEVGPRYYASGDNDDAGKPNDGSSKGKEVDNIGGKDGSNKELKEGGPKEVKVKGQKQFDPLTSRTGGAYIPPARLKMMQDSITDKGSAAYQRLAWEALKKSIQGHVNKVNTSNIQVILQEICKENIVRGKGLLCRALIQAQVASPSFTNVYAAFTAVLNSKFPRIGELLLKRLIVQFRRGFKRNDKTICITAVTFIAHLVNQEVAHEIIALEILTLLLENPTEDSVEVAIAFLKECGMKLMEVSSKGVLGIFDTLRNLLHEGKLEKRVQYMIEVMFQIRKEDFKAHPAVLDSLNIVPDDAKILHMVTLEENHDPEDILNVFKFDPDYEANEAKYKSLVDDDEDSGEEGREDGSSSEGDSEEDSEEEGQEAGEGQKNDVIVDRTETNLVALRKTIYLTIQSSLDFEECAHKLLRMELKPGQEIEMAHMFLDCCSEQRTYEKFFGLLSQRFCQINRSYIGPFEETFRDSYATIHRMSNDKLRNIAKLFAHLLYTDAISWDVLATIRLNEDDTNSSSRIFIKILFLELSEYMGLAKLNQRVKDPSLQTALEGLFPRDNPKHTRFAINFFTSIGLGGLTDELREHLKAQPKPSLMVPQLVEGLTSSSSSSSDSSSSSSDSSDSSSSDSSSSESEEEKSKRKKKTEKLSKKKKSIPRKKVEKEKTTKTKKKKSSPPRKKRDR